MAYKLQLKRGLTSALPTGSAGEPLFTTDTNDLYIGTGAANQRYQKYIASGSSSQFLKGDGTLDSTTYTPTSRTLTINGTSYDLSANRTWNVGTVTTAAATTGGQVAFFNGATVITSVSGLYFDGVDKLGIGNSSPAFNLDVTGTARMTGNLTAASIIKSGGTSSQYLMADGSTSTLTNPVTGTGTTNYLSKWTSGSALGNSIIQDNGSAIGIGISSFIGGYKLEVSGLQRNFGANNELRFGEFDANNNYFQGVNLAGTVSKGFIFFGTSEYMRITPTGQLGIGTTSPLYKLDVVAGNNDGVVYRTSTRSIGIGQVSSEASLFWGSGTPLTFFSGSELMRLTSSGNLGIGVVPSAWSGLSQALQVQRLSFITSSSGANDAYISSNAYYDGSWRYIGTGFVNQEVINSNGAFLWRTAASGTAGNAISFTQAMTLGTNSGLSIGTTTAAAANGLLVAGAATFSSDVKVNSGTDAIDIGTATGNSYRSNLILRGTNASGVSSIAYLGINVFSTDGSVDLVSDNNLIFRASGSTERLRITSGGIVQVNTTASIGGGVMNLNGDLRFGGQAGATYSIINYQGGALALGTNNTEYMRITSGGNVGIGTTSPTSKFHVNGIITQEYGNAYQILSGGTEKYYYSNGASYNAFNIGVLGIGTTADPIQFATTNSVRMTIKSDGKINFSSLPTSATGLSAGDIWNDGGTLKIV